MFDSSLTKSKQILISADGKTARLKLAKEKNSWTISRPFEKIPQHRASWSTLELLAAVIRPHALAWMESTIWNFFSISDVMETRILIYYERASKEKAVLTIKSVRPISPSSMGSGLPSPSRLRNTRRQRWCPRDSAASGWHKHAVQKLLQCTLLGICLLFKMQGTRSLKL